MSEDLPPDLEDTQASDPVFRPARARPKQDIPPNSPEAEQHVIACCLLDEGSTVDRCLDARLSSDSFFSAANRLIFGELVGLRKAGQPIGLDTLLQRLQEGKNLDAIGGIPYVISLTQGVATTAHAGHFIEKVQEMSARRGLIKAAALLTMKAYANADLKEIVALGEQTIAPLVDMTTVRTPGKSLMSFEVPPDDDPSVLLGNRYVNRGDGAVIVGTSGIGKSSISIQMAAHYALGRPCFGIPCNGALRSLFIQSEDSDGDVAEVKESIIHSMRLTPEEQAQVDRNVMVVSDRVNRGPRFILAIKRHIMAFQPDLVWINPLQAFMDGDVTDAQDLGAFLREGLNGLNVDSKFAYVLMHHTTKPATGKDRAERLWHEVMYDMAGGAEIINWARAILSVRAAANEGQFNLVLAKRGKRAGVFREVEQGAGVRLEPTTTIPLKWADGVIQVKGRSRPMPVIYWLPRDGDSPEGGEGQDSDRPEKYPFSTFRAVFPPSGGEPRTLPVLHRAIQATAPLTRSVFYDLLQRWARDGLITAIDLGAGGRGYTLPA